MIKKYTAAGLAWRIWILTSSIFSVVMVVIFLLNVGLEFLMLPVIIILSLLLSFPAFVVLFLFLCQIKHLSAGWKINFIKFLFAQAIIATCYGLLAAFIGLPMRLLFHAREGFIFSLLLIAGILFTCSCTASFFLLKRIACFFSFPANIYISYPALFNALFTYSSKNNTTMETFEHDGPLQPQQQSQSNRLLIKGLITGGLILLMLIPTIFINNIIQEREQRQVEVVKEVSSKWASAQTIAGPYLVVPYSDTTITGEGKTIVVKKQLIILANDLAVDGTIFPEERPRSIYKVLLYKSAIKLSGTFKPNWPADINTTNIDFTNAKLCFGISDFKGIEEEITINLNNKNIQLSPGLPLTDLGEVGLSVPVSLTPEAMNNGLPFNMNVKLKGSAQLHFMPLSANSKFSIHSSWPNPSFDGNVLPNERQLSQQGFTAKWNFNQANLPFGTVLKQGTSNIANLAFGVSMVQPADQYDKTMRSVKYAILFIGLTFALFFIVEIMQRKAFHPVQYVLVGLALVIFYSLLLSISEYLLFDLSYLIAATATVLLITLYAKNHFASWKTAGIFFSTLGLLYGFIFILIRLEDTALLVGSIGLFMVLALVMYASRKVNWYGESIPEQ